MERAYRLPYEMIYDHACGTQRVALGVSLEFVKRTRGAVDTFHFPTHKTCTLAMHPSSYEDLRGCNTESQEQRNAKMKKIKETLTGLRDKPFMHFVVLTDAYHNLKAMFTDAHDVSPKELNKESWVRWARDTLFQ